MNSASCWDHWRVSFHLFCGLQRLNGFDPEAVVSGFEDVMAVSKAVGQADGHLYITEDHCPSAQAQVGDENDVTALVELAQQTKQKCPA